MSGIVDDMKSIRIHSARGFTLMEFTTIIAVIAILTAVSVVGYGAWQQSLAGRLVQTELKTAMVAATNEKMSQNVFPTQVPTGYKVGKDVTITYAWGSNKRVCLNGVAKKFSTVTYYISADATEPKTGACPSAPADLASDGNATYGTGYGNVTANINFTYKRVESQFVYFEFDPVNTATGYDVEYRKQPSTTWLPLVSNDPSTNFEEYLEFDGPGESFDVRVRAVFAGNVKSNWSTTQTFTSFAGPTGVTYCGGNGGPSLSFTAPSNYPITGITYKDSSYNQSPVFGVLNAGTFNGQTSYSIDDSGASIEGVSFRTVDSGNNLSFEYVGAPTGNMYPCNE